MYVRIVLEADYPNKKTIIIIINIIIIIINIIYYNRLRGTRISCYNVLNFIQYTFTVCGDFEPIEYKSIRLPYLIIHKARCYSPTEVNYYTVQINYSFFII